jgi:hypothetical protein
VTHTSPAIQSPGGKLLCPPQSIEGSEVGSDGQGCRRPLSAGLPQSPGPRPRPPPTPVRGLARARVNVIWRCWQDGVAYDAARRGDVQRLATAMPGAA